MIWQIKLFFAVLISLVATFLVLKYNESIEDAAEMRQLLVQERAAIAAQAATIATLHNERAVLEATLKEKESYEDAIRKQLGGVHRKLNDLLKDDPVAQEWHAAPLPDGVRAILHDDGVRDGREGNVRAPVNGADRTNSRPINPARPDRK